ncbi:MAG: homoserine dehydrogenase, partial [Desulfobacterales bacterium]|nr:homoserine dehydrogenase [Desulfobacterales bacterium]
MKKIHVGLLGFGTVGCGMVKILLENREVIESRLGASLVLKWIAVHDLERDREVAVDASLLTTDAEMVIDDPEVDIVVELIGGYEPAKSFILKAIENGKHVVTANKALLAVHGHEIFSAASQRGVEVGFEASVGGGIPLIRSIKEGLVANHIQSLFGILNGTANYILTKMTDQRIPFSEVLKEAQALGYAEADPTFDIEGIDTAHKLTILLAIAYGVPIDFDAVYTEGISKVTPLDIKFIKEFGYRIKLLAISKDDGGAVEARVHPTLIPDDSMLANVNEAYNALYMKGDAVGNVMLYGAGAGMMPTGSSVVSDLVDVARNILRGAVGRVPSVGYQPAGTKARRIKSIEELKTEYYFRFSAEDRPGVLSKISGILGKHQISIKSV